MSILHAINDEIGIVLSTWIGEISDADLVPSYKRLYEDDLWKPRFHEIVDLRNAKLDTITNDGLLKFHTLVRSYTDGKCEKFDSVLVASDELVAEIAQTYKTFSEDCPKKLTVFSDLNEAFKWFGVEGY